MSWEEPPTRRRASPSTLVVVILVAVGAVLAVVTSVDGAPDGRLPVDSDADDPVAAEEDEEEDGDDQPGDEDPAHRFGAEDPVPEDPGQAEGTEEDHDVERLGPSEERRLPGDSGLTLFVRTQSGALTRVDLDTGEARRRQLSRRGGMPMAVVGDSLLFAHEGGVFSLPTDLEGEPQHLASGFQVFSAEGDEAWVIDHGRGVGEGVEAQRVRVGAEEPLASFKLNVSHVVGAHGNRLIVEQHGHISSQDPAAGEGRSIGSGRVVGHRGGWVSWLDCGPELTCELATSSVDGDEQRRVDFDEAGRSPWFAGVLSPSGESVLAPVVSSEGPRVTAAVVSTTDGSLTELNAQMQTPDAAEWAPDGSWLFFQAHLGVHAWRPSDGELVSLDVGLHDGIAAMAVD